MSNNILSSIPIREIESIVFGIFSAEEIKSNAVCKITSTKLVGENSVYDERMGTIENGNTCKSCGLDCKNCAGHIGYIELVNPILHPMYYKYIMSILKCICFNCHRFLLSKQHLEIMGITKKMKDENRLAKIIEKIEKTEKCIHCDKLKVKISFSVLEGIVYKHIKNKKDKDEEEKDDKFDKNCNENKEDDLDEVVEDEVEDEVLEEEKEEEIVEDKDEEEVEEKDDKDEKDDKEEEVVEEEEEEETEEKDEKKDKKYNYKTPVKKDKKINFIKVQMSEDEIREILNGIIDEDVILLGFKPNLIHPKNMVITLLPVLPPISRPYIITEGILCDDDLTRQYIEIVKTNNRLAEENINEVKKTRLMQTLKFRIKTLMNNSQSKSRHSNGRPLKGIKERITGKEGLIRNNLLGKRCNQTARTVIGPDPTIRTDEMAIPEKIAKNLTIPERVNTYNISYLTKLVNDGKANYILKNNEETRINIKYAMNKKQTEIIYGDEVYRNGVKIDATNQGFVLKEGDVVMRDGVKLEQLELPLKRNITLQIGDVVERQLRNGDMVLLNRQPTLHKSSMLAKKIVVRPGKTFRFNLASCKTFNADFDGDEMNIHVPQNPDAIAELQELSTTRKNIMGPQSSKTNLCIVQDSLLGSYLMTRSKEKMPKERFFQICMRGDNWSSEYILSKIKYIQSVLGELGLPNQQEDVYTGKGLISMMLPNDFIYERKNDASKHEPVVKIYKGVMYAGVLNKTNLGSAHQSLLNILLKDYNEDVCINFINNIQFIACEWLLYEGFSVGIGDCITDKQDEIKKNVFKSYFHTKKIEQSISNPTIREARVSVSLNKAKDVGMKIARENMDENNSFIATVMSGSKGDFFNIAQITGLVGQQNITGKRVQSTFNHQRRTLPHYRFDLSHDIEAEYESKGFIRHSFMQGLNPKEFWYHAMSGREGVSDTAMKTSLSGYVQRKMVKVFEDVQIRYDGTVRNSHGSVIQWAYGDDDYDRTCTIVNGEGENDFCDVSRIADRININYEHVLNTRANKKK